MPRAGRTVLVALPATVALAAGAAAAEPLQLGGFIGPRFFSDDSRLGFIEDAPANPTLENSIQLGARLALPLGQYLVPEVELAIAPTGTPPIAGAAATDVFWMNPRAHLRVQIPATDRLFPFVVFGAGAPIALSSARRTYASDITYEGYVGAGVRFDSGAGFHVRLDARTGFHPGIVMYIAPEFDVSLGIELALGAPPKKPPPPPERPDRDRDKLVDEDDRCPDRAEDVDGFEDGDGCPDIDNDMDRVLDIADRCATENEVWNGYQDDDGCPDFVPAEIDQLRGTIEGLLYAEGETAVRDSAQPNLARIAGLLAAHPTVKIVLVGHTDDREANQFAEVIEGEPPPDLAALAEDLGRARAESVRQALITVGVDGPRIVVQTRGAEEPVADNATPKGRLANRRVELRLFVPPR